MLRPAVPRSSEDTGLANSRNREGWTPRSVVYPATSRGGRGRLAARLHIGFSPKAFTLPFDSPPKYQAKTEWSLGQRLFTEVRKSQNAAGKCRPPAARIGSVLISTREYRESEEKSAVELRVAPSGDGERPELESRPSLIPAQSSAPPRAAAVAVASGTRLGQQGRRGLLQRGRLLAQTAHDSSLRRRAGG